MKQFKYILIILLYTFLGANNLENSFIEKFIFNVSMRGMDAGESIITIYETTLEDNDVYKLVSETRTNKFFDLIYKIRDKIIMHVSKNDFSLYNVSKKIHQGSRKKNYSAIVDYIENKILFKDIEIPISGKVYDPLAIIFYLRLQNTNDQQIFNLTSYNKKKIKNLTLELIGNETLETTFGAINCLIFEPNKESQKDNSNIMKIWISNDEDKLPIKIEQISKNGKLILLLSSYVKN